MLAVPDPKEERAMTEQERLWEFVQLMDTTSVACLVEVAAILLADQLGLTEPDWGPDSLT